MRSGWPYRTGLVVVLAIAQIAGLLIRSSPSRADASFASSFAVSVIPPDVDLGKVYISGASVTWASRPAEPSTGQSRIFRSNDFGATWQSSAALPFEVFDFWQSPSGGTVYLATTGSAANKGLWISTDGGNTFTHNADLFGQTVILLHEINGEVLAVSRAEFGSGSVLMRLSTTGQPLGTRSFPFGRCSLFPESMANFGADLIVSSLENFSSLDVCPEANGVFRVTPDGTASPLLSAFANDVAASPATIAASLVDAFSASRSGILAGDELTLGSSELHLRGIGITSLNYGDRFIAAGATIGTNPPDWGVWSSSDAINWSRSALISKVNSVAFGSGHYVAGGVGGAYCSRDGLAWNSCNGTASPFAVSFVRQLPGLTPDSVPSAPPGFVGYAFRVEGVDLTTIPLDWKLNHLVVNPTCCGWASTAEFNFILLLRPTDPSGDYELVLELPDGRRAFTTFHHEAQVTAEFTWSMVSRFSTDSVGRLQYPRVLNPGAFSVRFDACASLAATTYSWSIGSSPLGTSGSCAGFTAELPQGTQRVTLTVTGANGALSAAVAHDVRVKDFLIVSIGDSVASGEGNPEVEGVCDIRSCTSPPTWEPQYPTSQGCPATEICNQNLVCDRSTIAGPAIAARAFEQGGGGAYSVTFLHLACSGARVRGGVLDSFEGANPDLGVTVQPQLLQTERLVESRQIDGLLMSIGANDVRFADVAADCFLALTCPPAAEIDARLRHFERDLNVLRECIETSRCTSKTVPVGLNLGRGRVYLTQYPDIVREPDGVTPCGHLKSSQDFYDRLIHPLNVLLHRKATEFGWHFIAGAELAFSTHGICAPPSDSWVRGLGESLRIQGLNGGSRVPDGFAHPNSSGQAWYGEHIAAALFGGLE